MVRRTRSGLYLPDRPRLIAPLSLMRPMPFSGGGAAPTSTRILIVFATTWDNGGSAKDIDGATFDGLDLIHAVTQAGSDTGTHFRGEIWYLLNPPAKTANIIVSYASATDEGHLLALYLKGAKQQGPEATPSSAEDTSDPYRINHTTGVANAMVVAGATGWIGGDFVADAPGALTDIVTATGTANDHRATLSAVEKATAGAANIDWSSSDPGGGGELVATSWERDDSGTAITIHNGQPASQTSGQTSLQLSYEVTA